MQKYVFLLTVALFVSPAFSENSSDGVNVYLSGRKDGAHVLTGEFSIASSTAVVWNVLTDYDKMGDFVSSINSSRRLKRQNDHDVVEQVMSGKAAFFRKRVYLLLNVRETDGEKIAFEDMSKKSFKAYLGAWEITPTDGQIRVNYRLEAIPNFFAPDFIAVKAFKNTVQALLREVRDEIMLRTIP